MLMESAGFSVQAIRWDGYTLGFPQTYIERNQAILRIFHRIRNEMFKRMKHPGDITLWNSHLCRLFLKPNEVIVIGRKTSAIQRIEPRGYTLVPA